MPTIRTIGFSNLKKGQRFKDKDSQIVDYYEVITDPITSLFMPMSLCVEVITFYTDGTTSGSEWYDYYTRIEEYELFEGEQQSFEFGKYCYHPNKRKVLVSNVSGYWFCPDCPPDKCDLGNLTEDEYKQCVKELYGGKESKRVPDLYKFNKKRK